MYLFIYVFIHIYWLISISPFWLKQTFDLLDVLNKDNYCQSVSEYDSFCLFGF